MRLTRAGLGLLIAAALCFGIGRTLGALELFLLGAMCVVAVVGAALYTATVRLDLTVARTATPARLRAGMPARIDLQLTNQARRATPVLRLTDQVSNSTGAKLTLAAVKSQQPSNVAYRLPTRRRGVLSVGPLDLRFGDPLGLTKANVRATEKTDLLVHPTLHPLSPIRAVTGHDPTAEQKNSRSLATSGDEFFALRPYVVGDELKRVNWRATARAGDLMVRQEERPRSGRITVVLDRRREVYDEDGFERAVSAALSALHAGWNTEDALRFVTSAGTSITDIRTRGDVDVIDEQLATLTTTEQASLTRTLEDLGQIGRGGTLVAVTGVPTKDLDTAVERARRNFGAVIVVTCQLVAAGQPSWAIPFNGVTDLASEWDQFLADRRSVR